MSRSNLWTLALAALLTGVLGGGSPAVAAPDRRAPEELSPQTWLERLAVWLSLPWRDWLSLENVFAGDGSGSSSDIPQSDEGHVIDPNG